MASAMNVQSYLKGLDYPSTKLILIDHAKNSGASQDILIALQNLPRRQYDSLTDITDHLFDRNRYGFESMGALVLN